MIYEKRIGVFIYHLQIKHLFSLLFLYMYTHTHIYIIVRVVDSTSINANIITQLYLNLIIYIKKLNSLYKLS